MVERYHCIIADNTEEMQIKTHAMVAQGYVPVGSIICGTREETVEHNIKGATTIHQTYLKQSFWYAPNADSPLADCVKQHELLENIALNACEPSEDIDGMGTRFVEVDNDLIEAVNSYLRGEA